MTQSTVTPPPHLFSAPSCPACDHPDRMSLGPVRYGTNALVADQDASELVRRLGRIELVECASCGFRWTDPQYSMEPVLALYGQNKEEHWDAPGRDWGDYLGRLKLYLKPGGAVLDVGCYTGNFLHALGPGYERHGIEPIPYAARRAREHGITVHPGTLQDAPYAPGSFDLITLWDVAEHLQRPREVFPRLASWLKPGGILALETGNVECGFARRMGSDWWYVALLEHCSFYTPESFRRIFAHAGLEMRSCAPTTHHYMSPLKLATQLGKALLYRTVSKAEERGVPFLKPVSSRLLHRHPPCALVKDHLFIIAQGAS